MRLLDTHVHLDLEAFDDDRQAVVDRAREAGVDRFIIPAIEPALTPRIQALAETTPGVFCCAGLHPNSSAGFLPDVIEEIRSLARHRLCVAVGEIGLDYHWDNSPVPVQRRAFEDQLALAADLELPVVIHNREATDDVLSMLRDWVPQLPPALRDRAGVLHAFSGTPAQVETAVELGFYLGFGGPLTYKNADETRRSASAVPLDRLLLETDAPYLTPTPHRGKRNEPGYVRLVAERMTTVRGITLDDLASATSANAERLFRLSAAEGRR